MYQLVEKNLNKEENLKRLGGLLELIDLILNALATKDFTEGRIQDFIGDYSFLIEEKQNDVVGESDIMKENVAAAINLYKKVRITRMTSLVD